MAEEFQYSQSDMDLMMANSNSTPKVEYEQGDWTALFQSINTMGALVHRGGYERMNVDTSEFQGVEFSRDAMREHLNKQEGLSQNVINQLMTRPIDSWADMKRQTSYLESRFQMDEQLANNWSMAGMLTAGLPMALLDIDSVVISPMAAGVNKLRKSMNLATKASKVAAHTVTGAGVGATSMLGYEAATGVYKEDSVLNSTLIGMGLGGTLGFLMEKGGKTNNILEVDAAGKTLSAEESKLLQIETAQQEKNLLDKLIDEVQERLGIQKETEAAVAESEKTDVKLARLDKGKTKEKLVEDKGTAKKNLDESRSILQTAKDALKKVQRAITENSNASTKAARDGFESQKIADELLTTQKQSSPIRGQITKLNNQMAKLKGDYSAQAKQTRALIREKLQQNKDKLAKIEAKIARLQTKASKIEGDSNIRLTNAQTRLGELRTQEMNLTQQITGAEQRVVDNTAKWKDAVAKAREFKVRTDKTNTKDSLDTKNLRKQLEEQGKLFTADGLRELARARGVVDADLARMFGDDFDVSKLYGIRREKKNFIDQLGKELEEINNLDNIVNAAPLQKLPEWARKLLISPIEKLLNSDNNMVAGFAALLHSGTLHHGKIMTETAWIIKSKLDNKLNWVHAAMTNNYKEALKDGSFSGKIEDFNDAVGKAIYEATGSIQRQLNEGISGEIVGMERLKIMQARQAGVKRTTSTGNKHIDKSVDEFLGYWNDVHAHGNKLGMEAFRNSIAQGYAKRRYSEQAFKEKGREWVVNYLTEAQKAKAISTNSLVTPEIVAEMRKLSEDTWEAVSSGAYRREQLTKPLGMPKQSTASSLKQRTMDAFDDDLVQLLDHDIIGTTQIYGLQAHGRLALKEKFGVDNGEQLEKMINQLGATPKEIDNLRVVIETIQGTREISKNPFDPFTRAVKAASSFSSIMHTMAFAIPTMTEIASVAKEFGWGKTIEGFMGSPRDIIGIYRNGSPSEKNTIEMMVSYGDAHFARKVNRMDVESNFDSVGRVQEIMDGIVRRESVWGGLLPITDMLRMTTASLSVDFLAKLSVQKNISSADLKRLGDMGFGKEDLPLIRKKLKVQSDGRIGNTDRKSWGKLDDKITSAVMTMTERTILNPNGATLPKFMTNVNEGQFVPRVMMKFMRFPFESYERLLLRGVQEADAKQLLALGGNIAMWTGILAMKDALRDEDKKQYADKDGLEKLMMHSFYYNSATSLPFAMADQASGWLTGKTIAGYQHRAGGAVQSDIASAQKGDLRFALPLVSVNIGDGIGNVMNTLFGLEESNK
jgi:hypothetical protein